MEEEEEEEEEEDKTVGGAQLNGAHSYGLFCLCCHSHPPPIQ